MRASKGLSILFSLAVFLAGVSTAYGQSPNANPQAFGKGYPERVGQLPASELKDALLALDPQSRAHAMHRLRDLVFTTDDLPYIKVDPDGYLFFVDHFGPEPADEDPLLPPVGEALTEAQTFLLHSRPGAPNVIYLDFDGHTFSNTAWSSGTYYGRAYDPSGNDSPPWGTNADCTTTPPTVTVTFSTAELARIHEIWHRIAEDFAPFNVDVTTEEPTFDRYTGRILFTNNYDYCGDPMPSHTAGGVAYVGVFGDSNYHTYTSPALVYNSSIIGAAEAGTHEMGHNLSLGHDGNSSTGYSYYSGHGSNYTSWGPIMGAVYAKHVTQWSKGDYSLFLQAWSGVWYQQDLDDLKWIDCRFALVSGGPNCDITDVVPIDRLGYAADDHADSIAGGATALVVQGDGTITVTNPETDPGNGTPANKGIIGDRDDVDFFYFDTGAGDLNIVITPAWDAFWSGSYRGANLDIDAALYDGTGTLVTSDAPTDETDAVLTALSQPAGRYYISIDGEGCVTGCAHEGYDDYASIGQYFISGTVQPTTTDTDPPTPAPDFASGPTATGPNSMTMTSTVAADASGYVEYQFHCNFGGAGCTASPWQVSTTYEATGLASNTTYGWQVRARDLFNNPTALSAVSSATTDNQLPTASFTHSVTGYEVTFTDTSTDGDGSITAWSWDFGSAGVTGASCSSSAQNPVCTYPDFGSYSVTLTVTDDRSDTDNVTNTVDILRPPPAAPTGLNAVATGYGEVQLTWTDNASDETGFVVERKPSASGTWTVLSPPNAANDADFTDSSAPTDGGSYDYRVKATGLDQDSAYSNIATVTQTMDCTASKDFAGAMWHQFALPCNVSPNTVADIFGAGTVLVYSYNPVPETYTRVNDGDSVLTGTAYWVRFIDAGTHSLTVSGFANSLVNLPLSEETSAGRYNLVAYLGHQTIDWSQVNVVAGSNTMSVEQADPFGVGQNAGILACDASPPAAKANWDCVLSRKMDIWDGVNGHYNTFAPGVTGMDVGTLSAFDAIWVLAYEPTSSISYPSAATAPPAPTVAEGKPEGKGGGKGKGGGGKDDSSSGEWFIRLVASQGGRVDRGNVLGQHPDASDGLDSRDIEEMYPFGSYFSLLFTNPLLDPVAWGYTSDFRATNKRSTGSWPFVVRSSDGASDITLTWEGDETLLGRAVIVNEQTGEQVQVAAGGSYTFTPTSGASYFTFVIE